MSFVICIQFYDSDKPQAMRLARMIADIEPEKRDDVEIIFVARFDCDHDHETIEYASNKFRISWITTHTKWTGWPGGPNAMARDTLEWISQNRKEADGVLMMEPDCVPIQNNWLKLLMGEWKLARDSDKWVMGAWRDSGGEFGHINGNSVVRPDFWTLADASRIDQHLAWDCALNDGHACVHEHWHITDLIQNRFQSLSMRRDEFYDAIRHDVAIIHGFKDDSAYILAKERMGL